MMLQNPSFIQYGQSGHALSAPLKKHSFVLLPSRQHGQQENAAYRYSHAPQIEPRTASVTGLGNVRIGNDLMAVCTLAWVLVAPFPAGCCVDGEGIHLFPVCQQMDRFFTELKRRSEKASIEQSDERSGFELNGTKVLFDGKMMNDYNSGKVSYYWN